MAKSKIDKKDVYARLTALEYYGTGDEGYELFQSLCEAAYRLYGLSDQNRAQRVARWAEEEAAASKKWWIETYGNLDEADIGTWRG